MQKRWTRPLGREATGNTLASDTTLLMGVAYDHRIEKAKQKHCINSRFYLMFPFPAFLCRLLKMSQYEMIVKSNF